MNLFQRIAFLLLALGLLPSRATIVLVSNVSDIVQMPGTTNYVQVMLNGKLQITNNGTAAGPIVLTSTNGSGFQRDTWGSTYLTVSATDCIIYNDFSFPVCFWEFSHLDLSALNDGQGRAVTNGSKAIYMNVGRDVKFSYLNIHDLTKYVGSNLGVTNSVGSNSNPCVDWNIAYKYPPANVVGIALTSGPGGCTNIIFDHNTVDMVGNGLGISLSAGYHTNIQFLTNTTTRCNWGQYVLQSSVSFQDGLVVDGARSWNQTNWNGNPAGMTCFNPNHGDSLIVSCNGTADYTATNRGMVVRNCWFGPRVGTNMSAFLYMDATHTSDSFTGAKIYNNIFEADEAGDTGFPFINLNGVESDFANNTLVGLAGAGSAIGSANTSLTRRGFAITNNLYLNLGAGCGPLSNWVTNYPIADYNLYVYTNYPFTGLSFGYNHNGNFTDFYGWRIVLTNDLNGILSTNGAFTWNSDFSVPTNSLAANAGANLTALGIARDFAGNLRPASGAWTIGAFEVNTNYVPPPPPGGAIAGYLGILK